MTEVVIVTKNAANVGRLWEDRVRILSDAGCDWATKMLADPQMLAEIRQYGISILDEMPDSRTDEWVIRAVKMFSLPNLTVIRLPDECVRYRIIEIDDREAIINLDHLHL